MKLAKAYCRASHISQVEIHQSVYVQQRKIEKYCDYKDLTLVKIYKDQGVSGKDMQRPAFEEMISELNVGDTIIVSELSRFSRNVKDAINMFADLEKIGVNFICLDPELDFGSHYGRAIIGFILVVDQLEREKKSHNVREAMAILKADGKLRTRPPFGWKFVGKKQEFIEIPEQQQVITIIIDLHEQGSGHSGIARYLNENGYNTTLSLNKRSLPEKPPIFYPTTVKRILTDYGLEYVTKSRMSLQQRMPSQS